MEPSAPSATATNMAPNVGWSETSSSVCTGGEIENGASQFLQPVSECLAIVVDHSIDAHAVAGTLARLCIERGREPAFVRFDNRPDFVSNAIADWCADAGVDSVFIDPGSPRQNA